MNNFFTKKHTYGMFILTFDILACPVIVPIIRSMWVLLILSMPLLLYQTCIVYHWANAPWQRWTLILDTNQPTFYTRWFITEVNLVDPAPDPDSPVDTQLGRLT